MKKQIGLGRGIVIQAGKIARLKADLKRHQIILGHLVNRLDIKPNGWNVNEAHGDTGLPKKSIAKIFSNSSLVRDKHLRQRDKRLRTQVSH